MKKVIIKKKGSLKHNDIYVNLIPKEESQEFEDDLAKKIIDFEYGISCEPISSDIVVTDLKIGEIPAKEEQSQGSNDIPLPNTSIETIDTLESYPINKFRGKNKKNEEKIQKIDLDKGEQLSFFSKN